MSHPLSEGGEFCAICERTIEWDGHSEVEHLKARVRELEERLEAAEAEVDAEREACASIADNAIRACITDEEREVATTIRNLILARGVKALKGEGE